MSLPVELTSVLLILAFVASLAVWGYSLHCWSRGRSPVAWRPREVVTWSGQEVVVGALVFFALPFVVVQVLPATVAETPRTLAASVVANGLMLLLLPAFLTAFSASRWSDLGLPRNGIRRDVLYGLAALLAAVLPVSAVQFVVRKYVAAEDQVHTIVKLLQQDSTSAMWLLAFVSAVVLAPLSEELLFRVVLQGWLEKTVSASGAIAVSSATFAAVHFGSWPDPLPLFPLAVVLGYTYYRRHSLVPCAVLHAAFNALNLLVLWLSPDAG